MKVKELASQAKVPAHVVSYYARIGLLKPQHNPENHYREFSGADIRRLHFIRCAQSLGYSLHEIAAMLQRLETGQASWGWLQGLLEAKHHDAIQALARLQTQMGHIDQLLSEIPDLSAAASCALPGVLTWIESGLGAGIIPRMSGVQRPYEPHAAPQDGAGMRPAVEDRATAGDPMSGRAPRMMPTASTGISGHGALVAAVIKRGNHAARGE
jgi:DNA-binding transcriptional MerR regulator